MKDIQNLGEGGGGGEAKTLSAEFGGVGVRCPEHSGVEEGVKNVNVTTPLSQSYSVTALDFLRLRLYLTKFIYVYFYILFVNYYLFYKACVLYMISHSCSYSQQTYNTIQYNTIQYSTVQYNTIQFNTIQYDTIQYSTIQYNTIQYNTVQYNTVHYNTIQYNTIQFNTIQYNTVQYNAVQYNTIVKKNKQVLRGRRTVEKYLPRLYEVGRPLIALVNAEGCLCVAVTGQPQYFQHAVSVNDNNHCCSYRIYTIRPWS